MSPGRSSTRVAQRLSLRLLGTPLIEVDGAIVQADTRKAVALVAYLAVTGQPQSRDTLARVMWPEYDRSHSGAALRRTLSVARAAMGGRWLTPAGRLLALEGPNLRCDVAAFRARMHAVLAHHPTHEPACHQCRRRLTAAVALHRGDFLEGFSLRDSPEFDDWQAATAAELSVELAGALELLIDAEVVGGQLDPALRHARQWLALDPLHEPAHRRLMELQAAAGDRAAAIRQYRSCVRILDDELGVPPLPETTATYERIAAAGANAQLAPVPASHAESAAASSPGRPQLPFVGRAAELARLAAVYDSTFQRGRIAIVEGEPGIGKSRLTDELAKLVAARGARVIATRGYPGESNLAYASISDSLRRAVQLDGALREKVPTQTLANAAALVPELADGRRASRPDAPGLDSDAARLRFLGDLASCLAAAVAGTPPGLLLIDDAQWLDGASAEVLALLARRIGELHMAVVLCRRSGELGPDRLESLKRDARRAGTLEELRLGRLDGNEVAELVAAAGQEPEVSSAVHDRSEGIPYFVVEYLEWLRAGAGAHGELGLPPGVRSLITSRLLTISPEARQVLAAAAVIGRSFDPQLVRRASGRSAAETVRALEELIAAGLVSERPAAAGGACDFDHEVTRDVVLAETSLVRQRLLHRRIADALSDGGRSRSPALIAAHLQSAGEEAAAAVFLREAADDAERLFANEEALELYRAALALDATHGVRLHERIGLLEMLLGHYSEAIASLESAAALSGDDDLARLEHELAKVHHRRGDWALADTHCVAALAALPPDAARDRARVLADRSLIAHRRGDSAAAQRFADDALLLGEPTRDASTLAQVHNLLGILAKRAGKRRQARQQLEQSLAHAVGQPAAQIAALNNLALLERADDQPERAIELTVAALRHCTTLGDRHREAALRNNLADLLHATGRREEAMAELTEAVKLFAEIGEPGAMQPEIWKLVEW